ncbi:MAG: 50S ribosome-binding GTPase, partial [Bifidobacteriaceae bacterium]|nr:50S ribosome-binding GTPase [Bifidobacteriaceae bacterium]
MCVSSPFAPRSACQLARALRQEVRRAEFPFPAPASAGAAERRDQLGAALDQQILPDLRQAGEPAVVALVGGTGVGKSALANALAGRPLSPVSPVRPTTRRPQLLATAATAALLGEHPVFGAADLKLDPGVAQGWALLDCGDPFAVGNDPLVAQPDVPVSAWLVVTSALRYGDALLWDLLRGVGSGGAPLALVVNRLPVGAWEEIRPAIARRLESLSLGFVRLLPLPDVGGAVRALPADGIVRVREWLEEHVPRPDAPLPPAVAAAHLGPLAESARELARDQMTHARAVALLLDATRERAAEVVARARAVVAPPAAPAALTAAWLELIAPAGLLRDVILGPPPVPEQRERWSEGLVALGAQVDDAVSQLANAAVSAAVVELAELWRGPAAPSGSRELLVAHGFGAPEAQSGAAVRQRWSAALGAALVRQEGPNLRLAAEALTQAGLAVLIQAAVLGAAGPGRLLEQVGSGQANAVLQAGRAALGEAM